VVSVSFALLCFRIGSFTEGKSTKIISISSPIDEKDAESGGIIRKLVPKSVPLPRIIINLYLGYSEHQKGATSGSRVRFKMV
jgi:hypothetical protein